jgi:N-acetylneuraminic acid mutarotase
MLSQRKLQNVLMISVFVFVGLLLIVSNCLAQNGTWNQKANIPTARLFASSCELEGKVYVIGGAQSLNSSLNTIDVYDPATDTWDTTKTDMPTARAELCVATVNGKIYAIGGTTSHNGPTIFGTVEEYNPTTDSWDTNKQPMPTARKGTACAVIDNKIYVAGGSAASFNPSNILEVYDPATDNWTPKANMLAARYYPQGAVLNDTFYVSGGIIGSPWTGQIEVQKYDPT